MLTTYPSFPFPLFLASGAFSLDMMSMYISPPVSIYPIYN
jgi:hypothetical protein